MTDDELIEKYIEPDPHKRGRSNVRLKGYGMHVWALIGHVRGTDGTVYDVAEDYDIPLEAAEAAFAYYRQHQGVIDCRLDENNEAFLTRGRLLSRS